MIKETLIVDKSFLQSKIIKRDVGWNAGEIDVVAGRGNVIRITDEVFKFTEYNLLPINGSSLNAHYNFYVNYKTFKYALVKDSEYGSLTYTLPTKSKGIVELNSIDIQLVESIIASKLLGAYFHGDINGRYGDNLIDDIYDKGTLDYKGEYMSYYFKDSIICEYDFFIEAEDLEVAKVLTE